MLVKKNKSSSGASRVKFISYTGKWPNLCTGILTLEIDGEVCKFGHNLDTMTWDEKEKKWVYTDEDPQNPNYEPFWHSGGSVTGGPPDYDFRTHCGEWEIDVDELDQKFWDVASEIDDVFNANVEWGCCGGCS